MSVNHPLPQTGAALPVCLALATLIVMAATRAMTAAGFETRLISSATEYQRHFAVAEQALSDGLTLAADNTNLWPAIPDSDAVLPHPLADISLRRLATDTHCPGFTAGVRTHLEIRATLAEPAYRRRRHVLGFSVCSEECSTTDCLAAVAAPVMSYWLIEDAA